MKKINRRDFLKLGTSSLVLLGLGGCERTEEQPQDVLQDLPELNPLKCDYLLHKGLVVDGSGEEPFVGDVAVANNQIVAIDKSILAADCRIIDARNKVIAPGFIDIHTHTEDYMLHNGSAEMILLQGVTTQIGGNCGSTRLRIGPLLDKLDNIGINFGMFSGLRELRRMVVSNDDVRLSAENLQQMLSVLEENLQAGVFGLSTGLEYWPQIYTSTEEVIELCKLVAAYGGFYATHIRSEGDRVVEALQEAIEISSKAKLPLQYSHIKAAHQRNWSKMDELLGLVEKAKQDGLDIKADVYGYNFTSNDLGPSNYCAIDEHNLKLALSHPLVMIGSDSGLKTDGVAIHPRAYGNYPRIISKYVRDEQVVSLQKMIHKMTAMPADRLGLTDRGRLARGMKADIVVFDLNKLEDCATRQQPNLYAKGVETVMVNGKLAVEHGKATGSKNGQVLRRLFHG